MFAKIKFDKNVLFLMLVAALFFVPFNGGVHLFDWDEINFAESAREMIVSGNYLDVQIDYKVFWEKPPLFIWMQVVSMKLFGVNEFAARFPNAVCGIVVLLMLYFSGRRVYNQRFGLIWSLCYACSLLPFFYFKSGIIDPWFNAFIFLSFWFLLLYSGKFKANKLLLIFLSALFLGLAVLTKGPVAILIVLLSYMAILVVQRARVYFKIMHLLLFIVVFAMVGGLWFILQMLNGNLDVIRDFIDYQIRLFSTEDAGHGGFVLYHVVVLFFGVFPASIFALRGFFRSYDHPDPVLFVRQWMIVLFLVVLILFTIVETKILHYSSMCYFPLSFLAALQVYRITGKKDKLQIFEKIVLISICVVYTVGLVVFSQIERFRNFIIDKNLINDQFAMANLQADANWLGFEWIVALLLLGGILFYVIRINSEKRIVPTIALAASLAMFHFGAMVLFVPRAEAYTQHAAIAFFKSLPQHDCYVKTLGYKSYAELYYFEKPMPSHDSVSNTNWLLYGNIDKPAYFISKNTKKEEIVNEFPFLQIIGEKNGFVFYLRENE